MKGRQRGMLRTSIALTEETLWVNSSSSSRSGSAIIICGGFDGSTSFERPLTLPLNPRLRPRARPKLPPASFSAGTTGVFPRPRRELFHPLLPPSLSASEGALLRTDMDVPGREGGCNVRSAKGASAAPLEEASECAETSEEVEGKLFM